MPWSQIQRTAVVALTVLVVVGAAAAPVAAIDGADTTETEDNAEDDEFPEEVCTDVTGLAAEEVPFDQVIWIDDLPEELQPDNVPANLVTPRTVAAIATGVTPNQCEVFDPNDPPYDPREDDVDPDGDADVVEETEEGSTLIVVNGTLNRSADGPGFEVLVETVPGADGELDPEVSINDGEKDYVLDPGVQYWEDGTVYLENDVVVIGKRAGVEYDCNGEECELDVRGAPHLADYPTVPSHTDEDHTSDATGDDGDDSDVDEPDGADDPDPPNTADSTDTTDADDTDDAGDADDGDDAESTDAGEDDGSDAGSDDGSDADGSGDDTGDGTETADDGAGDDGDQPAQAAAQGDGPGFGAGLAVLSVLFATVLARRRVA